MQISPEQLAGLISKRMTLNLLIQGSADHAALTAHYLVQKELSAIQPNLVNIYDKFIVGAELSGWYGMNALTNGSPRAFWRRVRNPGEPFAEHPLLVRHGPALAEGSRQFAVERARKCGVTCWPVALSFQIIAAYHRVQWAERGRQQQLEALGRKLTAMVWGVDEALLDGKITRQIAFGELRPATTGRQAELRRTAVGYGGVVRTPDGLRVCARGFTWILMVHELMKGTAELICMHGFNTLDSRTWKAVTKVTDNIELEAWSLQAGAELWRRLLAVLPPGYDLAHTFMRIALLSPEDLETLMVAVLEDPTWARQLIVELPDRVGE